MYAHKKHNDAKTSKNTKLRKNLKVTLKRGIILVRTSRFWYDNGMLWYCNCCFEIMNDHKKSWKFSVAATTPIRFRSCLGTTTRTPTPLRWFVPLSTSLRTANYSSTLKSAWDAVPNNGWYQPFWYEYAVIGTTTEYCIQHPSFCGFPWEEGRFLSACREKISRKGDLLWELCYTELTVSRSRCTIRTMLLLFAGSIGQREKAYIL